MKLLSMMKYQLKNVLPWLLAFYLVMLGNVLVFGNRPVAVNQFVGLVIGSTSVFTFFLGLFSFHSYFRMALAQGMSRKAMFASNMIVLVSLSVLTYLFGAMLSTLLVRWDPYNTVRSSADMAYRFALLGLNFTWQTCLCIITAMTGYFIAVLFYRLSRIERVPHIFWILGGLLAISLFFGRWIFWGGALILALTFEVANALSPINNLFYIISAAVFLLLTAASWLLIRRATISAPDPATATEQIK